MVAKIFISKKQFCNKKSFLRQNLFEMIEYIVPIKLSKKIDQIRAYQTIKNGSSAIKSQQVD